MRVTSAQANDVLRDVKRRFRAHIEADRDHDRWLRSIGRAGGEPNVPKLVRNWQPYWDGAQGTIPYAILWEDGPSEWVYQYLWGESDPEFGWKNEPAPPRPGVFMDAGTSFILCLFPE